MWRAVLGCALLLAVASPVRAEYAFNKPEVLAAQLLWGVAHGARLLALDCARNGKYAATKAWIDWQEREEPQIFAAARRLERHYFNAEETLPAVISAAIGLKPTLDLSPEVLESACATLAEALAQPRYDLLRLHAKILEVLQRGGNSGFAEMLR